MEARDTVVELLEELKRRSSDVAAGNEMAEIDVGHICFRYCKRLIEGRHAALRVGVISGINLVLLRKQTDAVEKCSVGGQFQRDLRRAYCLDCVEDIIHHVIRHVRSMSNLQTVNGYA